MSKDAQGQQLPRKGRGLAEPLAMLFAIMLWFVLVRPFVVEVYNIPSSEHMAPTFEAGDRVFVDKTIYRVHEPERNDIIVFRSIEGDENDLIRRVVGLPGDEISVQDGILFVNGERQEKPYINQQSPDSSFFGPTTVPEGEVFVMGDNPADSRDSRFFGPVPFENIEGKPFLIFWPPGHIKHI